MSYLFTSESVSEGHPDKISDQISDALLDEFLAFDGNSKVAIETLVTTGQVVISGEVKSKTYVDVQEVARRVINKIGYTNAAYRFDGDSCGVLVAINEQTPDINQEWTKPTKTNRVPATREWYLVMHAGKLIVTCLCLWSCRMKS